MIQNSRKQQRILNKCHFLNGEFFRKKYIKTHLNKSFGKKQLKNVNKKAMYQDLNNWIMLSIDEEDVFINKDFLQFNYALDKAVTYTEPQNDSGGTTSHYTGKKSLYSKMVAFAMKFLGNRYVWGGTSLTNGTDCSGFTMRIYEHFGYKIHASNRKDGIKISNAYYRKPIKIGRVIK